MPDFRLIAEKIKNKALGRGYRVDSEELVENIEINHKRLQLYKTVFSTEEGKWVLTDLMKQGGLLSAHEVDNPIELAHLAGKRSMAIHISSNLGLTFEQFIQLYDNQMK